MAAAATTYLVDNADDQAIEDSDTGGTDLVKASVSFNLGAFVEKLTLTGAGHIDGTGNGSANVITGNSGDNLLDGKGGDDELAAARATTSTLSTRPATRSSEKDGNGTDRVESAVSFQLTEFVENLTSPAMARSTPPAMARPTRSRGIAPPTASTARAAPMPWPAAAAATPMSSTTPATP